MKSFIVFGKIPYNTEEIWKSELERGGMRMTHNNSKQKILLAIGNRPVENFLVKQLDEAYTFVGTSTYREGVLQNIEEKAPDVVILREGLAGNMNISEIIYDIRQYYPSIRIIFITGDREPGDAMLAMLVNMQIFDILASSEIQVAEILELIKNPNQYQHVAHFQPKVIVDEKSKQVLFDAPEAREVVKNVERTIYVERDSGEPEKNQPAPQDIEKKSRKSRSGLFGKKEESIPVNEIEPAGDVEQTEKKGFFSRKSRQEPMVQVEEPIVDKKAIKRQQEAERKAALELLRKESERQREEEEAKRQHEEVLRQQRDEEARLFQEQERLRLKTLELQKESEELKRNREAERFINREIPKHSKQKILTFVGSEHGVGNTQVAFNTAIQLATNGYKTIYIELKERPSTIDYLYQLHRNADNGLEAALFSLNSQDYHGVHKSITRMKDVIERTSDADIMLNAYKSFPTNLDYLFFSPGYTDASNELSAGNPTALKELCMHLLFEGGYHFIVLDADIEKSNPYTEVALRFGTHVFYTLTQDVCHIGNSVRHVTALDKSINLVEKLYYVVNKYEDAELNRNAISDWLKTDVRLFVPNAHREFMDANYNGMPVLLGTRQKELKKSFMEIAQMIQNM